MKDFLQRADFFLIDTVFQPLADRLPPSFSLWSLAMSCQIGSVVFQVVSVLMPILLFGASLGQGVEASLALVISIIFFLGLRRFEPLIRPGMANPLREMFWGLRIIGLGFLLYQGWSMLHVAPQNLLWAELSEISQLIFIIGLYFMGCQPRPPSAKTKKKDKKTFSTSFSSSRP